MNPLDYQYFYRKNLPHFQPSGATLFVTFRLAGSIPMALLAQWKKEAEHVKGILGLRPEYVTRFFKSWRVVCE
jgi:hypothetical protein